MVSLDLLESQTFANGKSINQLTNVTKWESKYQNSDSTHPLLVPLNTLYNLRLLIFANLKQILKDIARVRNCPDITILDSRLIHGRIHGLGLNLGIIHGVGHGVGYV